MPYSINEIKNFYENILIGIVKKFPRVGDFLKNPTALEDEYYDIFTNELIEYAIEKYNCHIYNGAYRVCFIVNDGNIGNEYVLKFSYGFETYGGKDYDSCEIETKIYSLAKAAQVSHFFAEILPVGRLSILNGLTCPMFLVKRCDISFTAIYDYSTQFESVKSSEYYEYARFVNCFSDTNVAEAFLEAYKENGSELDSLFNFICRFGVCDLHNENVGFNKDCLPIIIDYGMVRDWK